MDKGIKVQGKPILKKRIPYSLTRMKPLVDKAKEGRVNPKGIPCLYLATKLQTAINEIRPWIGSYVSVAKFEVVQDLILVDCSKNIYTTNGAHLANLCPDLDRLEQGELSNDEIVKYVWSWIDTAFSRPINPSDDEADYVPTQILAELFKSNYDGIIYNSLFANGKNVILFSIDLAEVTNRTLYRVTNMPPCEFVKHQPRRG